MRRLLEVLFFDRPDLGPRILDDAVGFDREPVLEPPPPQWDLAKRRYYLVQAQEILDALRGASAPLEARLARRMREYGQYCAG